MKKSSVKILAVETSCDDTAAAVIAAENKRITVRSSVVSSQIKLHARYGGVFPTLAAREHEKNLPPVLKKALQNANVKISDIDLVAATTGPGLMPSLVVGVSAARALSYRFNKPLLGIHHIEGHICANFIDRDEPEFPLLALVVSGGHTQLVLMRERLRYEIVGQTLDDAAGEAFDKAARILGLPYPGGPAVSKLAGEENIVAAKLPKPLPRPMLSSGNYDFSFSGIKTAVLYLVRDFRRRNNLSEDSPLPESFVKAVAAEFQDSVVEVLTTKTLRAAQEFGVKTVTVAGGVAANALLRHRLTDALNEHLPEIEFLKPELEYCTDNAAMIGAAAAVRWNEMSINERTRCRQAWRTLDADANLVLR